MYDFCVISIAQLVTYLSYFVLMIIGKRIFILLP